MELEIKPHKDKYEVNLKYSKRSKSCYTNLIDIDIRHVAKVLVDLELQGFPMRESMILAIKKLDSKDWLGL